jgi:hypothetical protein
LTCPVPSLPLDRGWQGQEDYRNHSDYLIHDLWGLKRLNVLVWFFFISCPSNLPFCLVFEDISSEKAEIPAEWINFPALSNHH